MCTTISSRVFIVGSCLFAFGILWTMHSFSEPGGMLHGARIWSRLLTNVPFGPETSTGRADFEVPCDLHDPDEDPLEAIRSEFGSTTTVVYGWPSTGGVWVHEACYGVELDFLGLSRFEPSATERFSKEEDEFCQRLEWIGAHFYDSDYAYKSNRSRQQADQIWYGWPAAVPEGGLWALRTTGYESAAKGVSRIRNALTMEERCDAIKTLGGTFYTSWEEAASVSGVGV